MITRIRNAWAVLTGKATVCAHVSTGTFTLNYNGDLRYYVGQNPVWSVNPPTMATPFRKFTIQ